MISIVVDDCEWNLSQKVSIKRELKVITLYFSQVILYIEQSECLY